MRSTTVAIALGAFALVAVIPAIPASAAPRPAAGPVPLAVHHLTITRQGVTAHVTIRGDWHLSSHALPSTRLPRPRVLSAPGADGYGKTASSNWGGYVDAAKSGVTLRYVSANFDAPDVDCTLSTQGSSGADEADPWTGLDGWTSSTVEQDGYAAGCQNGTEYAYAWYEMYPANPVTFSGVNPGDALQSSVYYNPSTGKYSLDLVDLTQGGAGIYVTTACAKTCKNSSAEVIMEAPGGGPPAWNLSDFGALGYTNASVTSRSGTKGSLTGNKLWNAWNIEMAYKSSVMATAGPLQGTTAFLESWHASS